MKSKKYFVCLSVCILLLINFFVQSCSIQDSPAKTYDLSNYSQQKIVFAAHAGVASEEPLASKIGLAILKQGGNAIDAAIAIQLALAVVYPEAGNIGGGGFMIMRLKDGTTKALDFRETAPLAAGKNMYIDENGEVDKAKSLEGHLAPGVPGTIAGIFESLKYARLPFKKLVQPAIALAEKGYVVTSSVFTADPRLNTMPNIFDGRKKYKEGDTLRQLDLANTLKRIRDYGRKDFYEGKTAHLIVEEMKRGGGIINLEDLKNYNAKWRTPISFSYRGYDIVSMPLPSSGGILLNEMLKMIEPYPMHSYGYGSVASLNLMIEATRRAYRDRAEYLGDGDFSEIPVKEITSQNYLKKQMSDFVPGVAGVSKFFSSRSVKPESKETTHFSVVDAEGNAVAVTTTLNTAYGCRVVVGGAGFFLNNEMNDFALQEGVQSSSGGLGGKNNLIEPGKRMLSSMSPTIVTKDNKLVMVLGTPGGTTIPTSIFQSIVDIIDFNMTGTDAVFRPKFHHEWWPDEVSIGKFSPDTIAALKKMGYKITGGGGSSVQLIRVYDDAFYKYEVVSQHGSAEGF